MVKSKATMAQIIGYPEGTFGPEHMLEDMVFGRGNPYTEYVAAVLSLRCAIPETIANCISV